MGLGMEEGEGILATSPAAAGLAEKGDGLGRERSQSATAGFWGSPLTARGRCMEMPELSEGNSAINTVLGVWRCSTLSAVVCESFWVPCPSKSSRKDLVFTLWHFICYRTALKILWFMYKMLFMYKIPLKLSWVLSWPLPSPQIFQLLIWSVSV